MREGGEARPLRILHVLRAPVGGLFRHVVDLARAQTAAGHGVGIVADASGGGARSDAILQQLQAELALGVIRTPMSRDIGASDLSAFQAIKRHSAALRAQVVHGHGAKGGAYARLLPRGPLRVYTPHGGSLHYSASSPVGLLYLSLERVLARRTELLLFESAYGRDVFAQKVGRAPALTRVVHNGVGHEEFAPVEPQSDSTDLVFIGELRLLKGIDVLLAALQQLAQTGLRLTLTVVGSGPDEATLRAQVTGAGLDGVVQFAGAMPARAAFALGRTLVVPSRAESLPYIVLEAAAAGMPLIATRVGELPYVFGAQASRLVKPGDADALAAAIKASRNNAEIRREQKDELQRRVRDHFSLDTMVNGVLSAYREALNGSRFSP